MRATSGGLDSSYSAMVSAVSRLSAPAGLTATVVTASQINLALRKYVDLSKISTFKAGDFAKAKTSTGAGGQQER